MAYTRNILLLCLLLLTTYSVNAQVRETDLQGFKINKKPSDIDIISIKVLPLGNDIKQFYDAATNKPLDGTYHIIIHRRRYLIGELKNGLPHGIWEEYLHPNLHKKETYKEGQLDGKVYRYSSSTGNVESEKTMKNGVEQEFIYYYKGKVRQHFTFDEQGEKHGHFITYDFSGNISDEETYVHGKREGEHIQYRDGAKTITNYKNGKIMGEYTEWYPNGLLKQKGTYDEENKRTGYWVYYAEDGNLKSESNYLHGKRHGEQREYFKSGILRSLADYKNDKRHGRSIHYREDPHVISSEGSYVDGNSHGEYKTYHNGELWRVQIYRDNNVVCEKDYDKGKIRTLRLVDENGSLVNVAQYNGAGQRTYRNTNYKKPETLKLKEDPSGVIDVEFE